MILNSTGLAYDQPPSSPEQDPNKKLTAEKEADRKFFDLQRSRSLKRQKRVSQYGWLVMAAFIGAFIWLYTDTVNRPASRAGSPRFKPSEQKKATDGFIRDLERREQRKIPGQTSSSGKIGTAPKEGIAVEKSRLGS
jgi:hypothetical protein